VLCVRLQPENGSDDGDALRLCLCLRQDWNGGRGFEEGPAGNLWRHG